VAPTGHDDAAGDSAHPFASIGHALGVLQAGDTLVVHAGEYDERIRNPAIAPGRADAPITVMAAAGERPVIHGLLWVRDPTWWIFDGINVTWGRHNNRTEHMVKFTGGTDWSFLDAEVWGARSYAAILVAGDAARWRLAQLYVHDTLPANGDNQDHLLYINAGSGGGLIERCVLAHSKNGRAVKIGPVSKHDRPVGNVTVRFTTMYDNRGPSNVQFTGNASNNHIEHDIMVGAESGRANVTAVSLTGHGNVVADSVGWGSTAVFDDDPGIVDGGNNQHVSPQFFSTAHGDYRTHAPEAAHAGRYAT